MTYSKFSPCIKAFIQMQIHNQNILSLRKLSYGGLFFWIKLFIREVHIYRDANPTGIKPRALLSLDPSPVVFY